MKRIKILCVIDVLTYNGDINRVLQLATTIDRDRFDFRVATLRPPDPLHDSRYGSIRDEYAAAGVDVMNLGVARGQPLEDRGLRRHIRRANMLAANVRRIVDLVRSEAFDIVDGHAATGYTCGAIAGKLCGVPSILTTYNVREDWSPKALWYAVHQCTLAVSGAIVTDSEAVANQVRSWMLRRNHPHIVVIPNGPPPPLAARPEAEVRAALGLPPRNVTRVVGQIATLLPGKGQHVLLDAAPAVLARHPDVTFLLVGFERADQRGYTQELQARAERLGIAERTRILPYQGPIGDVWQTIDIHAHPTMLDSLPNCILEGMSLGKPAVVSSHAGIPTMVLDEETGLIVPPNDAAALSRALLRLLDDPAYAQRLGDAARARYKNGYTSALLARRMESLFEELVRKKAAA